MTLREFLMNYLNSDTIVTIFVMRSDDIYDIDTHVSQVYMNTVYLLLNDVQYINLLGGKVKYVAPTNRCSLPMLDIHISRE